MTANCTPLLKVQKAPLDESGWDSAVGESWCRAYLLVVDGDPVVAGVLVGAEVLVDAPVATPATPDTALTTGTQRGHHIGNVSTVSIGGLPG